MVCPLSFKEYLSLNPNHRMELMEGEFDLSKDPDDFIRSQKTFYAKNRDLAPTLFETFLIRGQFPEIVSWEDVSLAHRYIRESIVAKLIEYDLPKLYGFRKTDELGLFLSILARETGNFFEYETVAREVGVAQNTLKEYLNAFRETALVDLLYNFTKKHRLAKRQLKKSYIASPNLTCAIHNLTKENLMDHPLMGHMAETVIVNLLKKKYQQVFFWNQRGREVDVVVPFHRQLIPIEVKYRNRIIKDDLKIIKHFLLENDSPYGVVITKGDCYRETIEGKPLYFIPAWML